MTERVPRLPADEALVIAEKAGVIEAYAELAIFQVLLQSPRFSRHLADMLTDLLFRGTLDTRLRELIIMRLGWTTGSVYEWTQHWRIAQQLGVEADDLLAVRDGETSARWGDAERAILRAVDETVRDGAISIATWSDLEAVLPSTEERIEVVAVIGCWRMVSSILRSLDVPLEDGVEPWPPDGRAPTT